MIENLERRIRIRWMYASLVENRATLSANKAIATAAKWIPQDGRLTNRIELATVIAPTGWKKWNEL